MSTTDQTARVQVTLATATDVVSFPYKFLQSDDLVVSSDGRGALVLDTDYSVTGAGDAGGGDVTMIGGTIGERITVTRQTDNSQELSISTNGPLSSSGIEGALDKLTKITQDIEERTSRALTLPHSELNGFDGTIADATTRANKSLAFDENGDIEYIPEAESSALIAFNAAEAAAVSAEEAASAAALAVAITGNGIGNTDLTLVASSLTSVTLNWQVIQLVGVTGYKIYRSTDGVTYSTLVADTGSIAVTYEDTTTVIDGTTYYYFVAPMFGVEEGPISTVASIKPMLYVVPCMGQSNMVGYNDGLFDYTGVDAPNDRILQRSRGVNKGYVGYGIAGDLIPAQAPLQFTDGQDGANMAIPFSKRLLEYLGNDAVICLVPSAQGSTGFIGQDWNPNQTNYETALTETRAVLSPYYSTLAAILWMQGENDGQELNSVNEEGQKLYRENLQRMIARFRDECSGDESFNSNSPLIVGTLKTPWIDSTSKESVQASLRAVHVYVPYSSHANFTDLVDETAADGAVHYSMNEQRIMGNRMFPSYLESIENHLPTSTSLGLSFYYDFEDSASPWDTSFEDVGPLGNHSPTIGTGVSYGSVDGRDQVSVFNDTSTAKVALDAFPFSGNGSYTKCCWFRIADTNQENLISGTSTDTHVFWIKSAKLRADNSTGAFDGVISTTTILADTWYHGAVTYDGSDGTFVLYINGVQEHTVTSRPARATPAATAYIGVYNNGTNGLGGSLDNVRVYNRVLTSDEIEAIYNFES